MIRRINEIRRENLALQQLSNVIFLETYNEALIAYAKQAPGNTVICVVNTRSPQRAGGHRASSPPISASRPSSRSRTC